MIDILSPLIKKFLPFAQERMGFKNPPKLFLRGDESNAQDPLGKTAFYDPSAKAITLYTTNRHPKDVMRSLSHELVHHTQNCRGDFDGVSEMGEGYAQNDEHLREMEREAYEIGNMCFRDWEDSIKNTIYFESLQKDKGVNRNMSTKDWKNKEIKSLLSEAWGFKMDLSRLNEGDKKPDADGDRVPDWADKKPGKDDNEKEQKNENTNVFAPNHYCVHHGGVNHNGKIEMAEAVSHNYNEELGKVTHYNMKLADGTILENIALEDIQVTEASLAKEHNGHMAGQRDDDDDQEDLEEAGMMKTPAQRKPRGVGARGQGQNSPTQDLRTTRRDPGTDEEDDEEDEQAVAEGGAAARKGNEEKDVGRNRMHADRVHENEEEKESIEEQRIRAAVRRALESHIIKKD